MREIILFMTILPIQLFQKEIINGILLIILSKALPIKVLLINSLG